MATKPSKFHAAYNPIIFSFDQTDSSYEELIINIAGESIPLKRDYINGKAIFDISNIIRNYFSEKLRDSINNIAGDIFIEPALFVSYQVGNDTFFAINAVSQIGTSLDYSQMLNRALTTLPNIKVYEGYPLDISILTDSALEITQGTLTPNAINRIKIDSAQEINSIPKYFTDINGNRVLSLLGNKMIVGSFSIGNAINECIPAQPFYVRWINYKGGVDYYMFKNKQKRTATLSENQTYQRYITDYLGENGTDWSYYKKAIEVVTVGSELLTPDEYNALVKMTLAPYIEVYEGGKWKRIIIEQASNQMNTDASLLEFECNFLLPELNLQY